MVNFCMPGHICRQSSIVYKHLELFWPKDFKFKICFSSVFTEKTSDCTVCLKYMLTEVSVNQLVQKQLELFQKESKIIWKEQELQSTQEIKEDELCRKMDQLVKKQKELVKKRKT